MPHAVPGAANDPLVPILGDALAVRTRDGFALEGATPADARVELDGFEIGALHRDGRAAVTESGLDAARLVLDADATHGSGLLALSTASVLATQFELATLDASVGVGFTGGIGVLRTSLLGYAQPHFVQADRELAFGSAPTTLDAQGHFVATQTRHWRITGSEFLSRDEVVLYTDRTEHADQRIAQSAHAARFTLTEAYAAGPWAATLQQSIADAVSSSAHGLVQHADHSAWSFEARDELRRTLTNVAGLARLVWSIGAEAHVVRHDLDVAGAAEPRENVARVAVTPFDDVRHLYRGIVWRPDVAASTGATAQLSAKIAAYVGLRLDAFAGDLTLEPRGELVVALDHGVVARLFGGVFRRAADHGEELEHPGLHPERTTRVAFAVERALATGERGGFHRVEVYYDDRTHLIVRDGLGGLANTGLGTTYGGRMLAGIRTAHWLGQLAFALEHADRQDTPRSRVRTFEYDQPVRLDARVQHRWHAWTLGAHWELREGLPYTAVASAIYDSDRDVYLPQFATLYAERLPWHHQLDLRVDRELHAGAVRLTAYVEVANVYDHRTALDWAYNFDFTQRRAVEAPPITPMLGIRGVL